jgi:hypothetical protein
LLFSENVLEICPLFMTLICSWPIRLTKCGASLSMKDAVLCEFTNRQRACKRINNSQQI